MGRDNPGLFDSVREVWSMRFHLVLSIKLEEQESLHALRKLCLCT